MKHVQESIEFRLLADIMRRTRQDVTNESQEHLWNTIVSRTVDMLAGYYNMPDAEEFPRMCGGFYERGDGTVATPPSMPEPVSAVRRSRPRASITAMADAMGLGAARYHGEPVNAPQRVMPGAPMSFHTEDLVIQSPEDLAIQSRQVRDAMQRLSRYNIGSAAAAAAMEAIEQQNAANAVAVEEETEE